MSTHYIFRCHFTLRVLIVSFVDKVIYFCFTADSTGTESVYTVYEGHEIMFHVSTMLPHSKENKQQVRDLTSDIQVV